MNADVMKAKQAFARQGTGRFTPIESLMASAVEASAAQQLCSEALKPWQWRVCNAGRKFDI